MRRLGLVCIIALALSVSLLAIDASADGPTAPPSPTPTPTPSPSPTPTASPTSAVPTTTASHSATPSSTATATPTASPSASGSPAVATATASPSATPLVAQSAATDTAAAEAAREKDAALLANARTLSDIIAAQARVAQDELSALDQQLGQADRELAAIRADILDLQARSDARATLHDRLERDALRLAALPPDAVPPNLTDEQRAALDDVRTQQADLLTAQGKLVDRTVLLAGLTESVGAKQAQLVRLRDRARTLAAAAAAGDTEVKTAQVAVLTSLAQESTNAQSALAQLVNGAMSSDTAAAAWSMPMRGVITQPFGATTFGLEPPITYHGASYAHFHAAIDIAAPLGSPVSAAADGIVTFVGHLPDGAMIVLIAHAGGYVSEYAHLDDTFALPRVRAGQPVKAGQVIGYVGLTGMTTGPHLHFSVLLKGEPVDPLTLIGR